MTLFQAIFLSLLQGASELFPVSSLGHAVVFPALLHWKNAADILDSDGPFLPFLVTLHLGTSLALLIYYWKEWKILVAAFFQQFSVKGAIKKDAYMINLVILGTLPTALVAFVLEKKLRELFAQPIIAGVFLVINGIMMIWAERVRRRAEEEEQAIYGEEAQQKPMGDLKWKQALIIGFAQTVALVPGMSRSGATITAGILSELSHEEAAKFSFLLATPIILLAGIAEVPKLRHLPEHIAHMGEYSLIGFFVSGITAYLTVRFLSKYFQTKRLDPFGWYCIVLGIGAVVASIVHPS
jgi:undecaprenyl-diphosphatase